MIDSPFPSGGAREAEVAALESVPVSAPVARPADLFNRVMRRTLPLLALGFTLLVGEQLSRRGGVAPHALALLLLLGAALCAGRAAATTGRVAWWLASAAAGAAALLGAITLRFPLPAFSSLLPFALLAGAALFDAPREDGLARLGRALEALLLGGCLVAGAWWSASHWMGATHGAAGLESARHAAAWHLLAAVGAATASLMAIGGIKGRSRVLICAFAGAGVCGAWSELTRAWSVPARAANGFWLQSAPLLGFAILLAWASWEVGSEHRESADLAPEGAGTRPYLANVRMPGAWLLAAGAGALAVEPSGTLLRRGLPGESWWLAGLAALALGRALVGARRERVRDLDLRRLSEFNLSLRDELSGRARDLEELHQSTRDLNASLNPVKVLHTGLERGVALLRAEGGALWLRAELGASLGAVPNADGSAPQHAKTSSSMAPLQREMERAATEKRVLSALRAGGKSHEAPVSEQSGPELFLSGAGWHLVGAHGLDEERLRTALIGAHAALEREGLNALHPSEGGHTAGNERVQLVPLTWNGGVAGVLALARDRAFSTSERDLAEALGREIGSALQNAHLFQEASRLADRDAVTDLLNHRAMQSQLSAQVSRARRSNSSLSLVMMDLHNFKFFNETYGHAAGDRVLRTVAACLREVCRVSDVLARFGPDEFLAVLPDTDAAGTIEVCSRMAARLQRESYPDPTGRKIPITLAFGAAFCPGDGETASELLARAAVHLDDAKSGGAMMGGDVGNALKIERASEEQLEMRRLKEREVGGSFGVLDALVTAIDNKDHYTRRHSEDVAHWAALMAHKLNFNDDALRAVRICGLLHDVGKIAVPDAILRKPGRLEDEEFDIMQQHPVFGALIVKDVPNLPEVLGGVRHHHERFDGKGYPDKLQGENIPLLGRLLAVPDCFSAMTTDRPYRKALTWQEALDEIKRGRGTQFDVQMADTFAQVIAEFLGRDKNHAFIGEGTPELPLMSSQVGDYLDATQGDASSHAAAVVVPRSVADAK